MSILSPGFVAFALAVILVSGLASRRARPWVLGGASLAFYALSDASHLWVLLALMGLVFGLARALDRASGRLRSALLVTGLAVVAGTLVAYKYLNAGGSGTVVPLGLSFYSLRLVGYLIDVHRRRVTAERHLGRFCTFVALFLEIGSGPIERASSLIPQLDDIPRFDYTRVTSGLIRITWGVFKKAAVANYLALPVAAVYGTPAAYGAPVLVLATVLFALQLYLDFSGYADIVVGAGQVLGLRLSENFARPYFAGSVAEFWNRWHISLSHWLRDYVFLPVAYASDRAIAATRLRPRVVDLVCYGVATMVTMLLAGLWHGAGWTFVIWGGLNGAFMALGRITAPWRKRLWRAAGIGPAATLRRLVGIGTTFALLCFAWVFFRSATPTDALAIIRGIVTWRSAPAGAGWLPGGVISLGIRPGEALVGATFLLVVLFVDVWCEVRETEPVALVRRQSVIVRWGCYYAVACAIFIFGLFGQGQFLYFQF
ncbi:MAG TPA: MBOAT family O-acyltransferase [Polyangia bacterium]|jgi:D-alanyl-lipoteichoic acid acyltransferase DltB (MBOAT superfamily)